MTIEKSKNILEAGVAPPIMPEATHEKTSELINRDNFEQCYLQ